MGGIGVGNVQEGGIGSGKGFGFKLALYEVSVLMSPLKIKAGGDIPGKLVRDEKMKGSL